MSCTSHRASIPARLVSTLLMVIGAAVEFHFLGSTQSIALLTDMLHMAADILPLFIGVLAATWLTIRRRDVPHFWGYDVGTLMNAVSLVIIGIVVVIEAILLLIHNGRHVNFLGALFAAFIGLLCNIIAHLVLEPHEHGQDDVSEYRKHLHADIWLSAAVVLNLAIGLFVGQSYIDVLGAIVVGAWMVRYGFTSPKAWRAGRRLRIHFYLGYPRILRKGGRDENPTRKDGSPPVQ